MNFKPTAFFVSVAAAVAATVIICAGAFACRGGKIDFCATYYFIYYSKRDNAQSASAIAAAVSDYGGAGYVFEYGGQFYVTVSCYYSFEDADSVCQSLKRRDLDCDILKIEIDAPRVSGGDRNARLYSGNFNTLNSLSRMAYDCANSLDTGAMSPSGAKGVVSDIKKSLSTLIAANSDNLFCEELLRLNTLCENITGGRLYPKHLRTFQIAVCDTIVSLTNKSAVNVK